MFLPFFTKTLIRSEQVSQTSVNGSHTKDKLLEIKQLF